MIDLDPTAIGHYPRRAHPAILPDRRGGRTSVRDSRVGDREIERRTRGGDLGGRHEPVVE